VNLLDKAITLNWPSVVKAWAAPLGGATSVLFKKLLERFQKTNTDNIPAAGLSALIVTEQQVMDDHLQVVLDSIPAEEKKFVLKIFTSQTEKMRSERNE